jgi:hypothetical protein
MEGHELISFFFDFVGEIRISFGEGEIGGGGGLPNI